MNPNALQWASIALHAMDNATLLSFCHQVDEKCQADPDPSGGGDDGGDEVLDKD